MLGAELPGSSIDIPVQCRQARAGAVHMNERANNLAHAAVRTTATLRSTRGLTILAWLFSILLTLALAEFGLRIYIDNFALGRNLANSPRLLLQIPGSERIYGMVPNLPPPVGTNSLGFRGREFAAEKPAGTFRVLMLGDSITFGNSVSWDETFSHQLEEQLNASATGMRFEVLNTGVSGYNTRQELATLREIGLGLAPDIIVLNVCLNDSDPVKQLYGVALKNETTVSGWSDVNVRTIVDSSYLLTLLKHAVTDVIKRTGGNVRTLNSPKLFLDSRVREAAWQKMKAAMAEIHEEASQAGIPMAVIIYPYSSQLSLPAERRVPQQDLLAFFSARGVPALDATPAYADSGQAMFVDEYVHLSPQGHKRIAAAIADHLLAHGLLPVTTPGRPTAAAAEKPAD